MERSRKRLWPIVLAVFAGFAVMMGSLSLLLLSRWTDLETSTPAAARRIFAQERAAAGGGPAYVEIRPDGTVQVHREQEGGRTVPLQTLYFLAWEPSGRLARVELPFWFVRFKSSEHLNVGTFATLFSGDWEHLDLQITEEDLERRGPGLVLDHARADGVRILIRTE